MCLIAATQGSRVRDIGFDVADMLDRCTQSVRNAFDTDTGFSPKLPAAARGDVSLALVRLALESGKPDDLDKAGRAIRLSLIEAGPGGLPMLLPWIGFAEVELAGTAAIPSAVHGRNRPARSSSTSPSRSSMWRSNSVATRPMPSTVCVSLFASVGVPTASSNSRANPFCTSEARAQPFEVSVGFLLRHSGPEHP